MKEEIHTYKDRFQLWNWAFDGDEGFWNLDDENDFVIEGPTPSDRLKRAEAKMGRATLFLEERPYGRIYEDSLHGSRFLLQNINVHLAIPFEIPHCC